jgi:protein-lysine N-methyltransferase EEF2KMT
LVKFCKPNVILAADVIYDDSIFEALMKCITSLFNLFGDSLTFFLSQTIRNQETFDKFCNLLHAADFQITEESSTSNRTSNGPNEEIKILRMSKLVQ